MTEMSWAGVAVNNSIPLAQWNYLQEGKNSFVQEKFFFFLRHQSKAVEWTHAGSKNSLLSMPQLQLDNEKAT